jgi:hypothetical protein
VVAAAAAREEGGGEAAAELAEAVYDAQHCCAIVTRLFLAAA